MTPRFEPGASLPPERKIIEQGQVQTRPFGADESGRRIHDVSGRLVRSVVEQLAETVRERALQEDGDVGRAALAARDAMLELCERLNRSVPDAKYHVDPTFLRNEWHRYGYEYYHFILEHAKQIAGDDDLLFKRGAKSAPASLVAFLRPLPLHQVYLLAPRLTDRFVSNTRLEVTHVTPVSARCRLHFDPHDPVLNGPYARACRLNSCASYKGILASLPSLLDGRPWAQLGELACAARGDPYCEWHLQWQAPAKVPPYGLLGGAACGALGLTLALVMHAGPGWIAASALLPVLGSMWDTRRRLRRALVEQERERRQEVEELNRHYEQLEAAHDQLQVLTLDLEGMVRDRTSALAVANQRLNELAITDELTVVYNRRHFFDVLHNERERARRYHHELCLLIIDVDHFKRFNDVYGHPKGDRVLQLIGRILREGTRAHDTVARYGGEEFVVVLPQTDLDGAVDTAEKLRAAVAEAGAAPHEDPALRVLSVSVGVASSRCGQLSADALLQAADDALYLAKARGRNRVEVAEDPAARAGALGAISLPARP